MISIQDKWAFITGASRGIGQQVAIGMAKLGCNLVLHARKVSNLDQTKKLLEPFQIEIETVEGELADPRQIATLIESVKTTGKPIDILYNNAAIQNKWMSVWEIPHEIWLETFQINFFAIIQLSNAFIPEMIQRGFGRVVNVSSGIKDVPSLSPYSTTKAALDKYTQDLTAELKDTNVLVNCMDPGWLKTDLGGPNADHEVQTVLPGALVPVLLDDNGPSGGFYPAQDYRED